MNRSTPYLSGCLLSLIALTLVACASRPDLAPLAQVLDGSSLGLSSANDSPVLADPWWREFGDQQLTRLIEQALENNPGLKLAKTRLLRANAVFEMAEATNRPQLNAAMDVTHQRFTQNGIYPPPLAGAVLDTASLQATASWELDFFGKNSSALNAAIGSSQAARADEQAARSLLASQVARSYFQWLRIQEQIRLSQRILNQREEILSLVNARVTAGLDTRLELLKSQGALPETRQQIEALQEQASLLRNAIAALMGQSGMNLRLDSPQFTEIKSLAIEPVIPSNLLGRRADITAARWRVEAASQEVSNASSQFYPNVNLVAFAGFSSIGIDKLLEAGSQQWGVGPAIRLPLFDGGRLRANLRARSADLDAAIESYNSSVIEAVREVADQLASSQSIALQQTHQLAMQLATEAAYEIVKLRYQAGLGTYLQVLASESAVLNQRRLAVDLQFRSLDTQVALIRALGGNYRTNAQTPELPRTNSSVHAASTGIKLP